MSLVTIVDDEASVRKALSRLVRAAGFEVETFSSGAEFLAASLPRRPQCLILDLRMPHVSGFDVQQALSLAGHRLPVVVITGDDSPESRERALKLGARAYLRKPVDDAILLDAIRTAIASVPPSAAPSKE